jgi:hypothetical protein
MLSTKLVIGPKSLDCAIAVDPLPCCSCLGRCFVAYPLVHLIRDHLVVYYSTSMLGPCKILESLISHRSAHYPIFANDLDLAAWPAEIAGKTHGFFANQSLAILGL